MIDPDDPKASAAEHIADRRRKWKRFIDEDIKARNGFNSSARSRVERSIGAIKRVIGFEKERLSRTKSGTCMLVMVALARIILVRYSVLDAIRQRQGKRSGLVLPGDARTFILDLMGGRTVPGENPETLCAIQLNGTLVHFGLLPEARGHF